MTEGSKPLSDAPGRDALADGAARFDQMIETVRAQHAPAARNEPEPIPNPFLTSSPGEDWAREYQNFAIGPAAATPSLSELPVAPKSLLMPGRVELAKVSSPVPSAAAPPPAPVIDERPIGNRIGKAERRRSWFARMFGRAG